MHTSGCPLPPGQGVPHPTPESCQAYRLMVDDLDRVAKGVVTVAGALVAWDESWPGEPVAVIPDSATIHLRCKLLVCERLARYLIQGLWAGGFDRWRDRAMVGVFALDNAAMILVLAIVEVRQAIRGGAEARCVALLRARDAAKEASESCEVLRLRPGGGHYF